MEKTGRPGSSAWETLLNRAVMALDDDELSTYRNRKETMERRLERNMKERGLKKPPYDFYMVQEVLVEYDRRGILSEALVQCNGREAECVEARKLDADIWLVWNFVEENLKDRMAARAIDIAQTAQNGLRQKVTDGECKLDTRALKMALESTVPALYGGGAKVGGAGGEAEEARKKLPMNGGIMINIVGDAAAKLIEPKSEGRAGGVFIDV